MKKRIYIFLISLAIPLLLIASCSGILGMNAGNNNNTGHVVKIVFDDSDFMPAPDSTGKLTSVSRTIFPKSSTSNYYYTIIFKSNVFGELSEKQTASSIEKTLELGTWKVEITRYETDAGVDYQVARGEATFTLTDEPLAVTIKVELKPIPGGTGRLKYLITVPSGKFGINAFMQIKPVPGTSVYQDLSLGKVNAGGISNTINLPTGAYDIIVTLADDAGHGTGRSTAARIYSGLETDTANFFKFEPSNFVEFINIAGHLNFKAESKLLPDMSIASNVTISAHAIGAVPSIGTAATYKWTGNSKEEWIIKNIPAINRSVDLSVTVTTSGGILYTMNKALTLNNIPDNGSSANTITTGIYEVTVPSFPNGNITATGAAAKPYCTPGETVTLTVSSDFGLKNGTLKVTGTGGGGDVTLNGSASPYTFIMPNNNVTVSAGFFNAILNNITLSPSAGVNWAPTSFSSATKNYDITLPMGTKAIQVNAAVPAGNDDAVTMAVSGTGSLTNPSTNALAPTVVKISVMPPSEQGGHTPNTYTLNITRTKSDNSNLSSLSVSAGSLFFNGGTSYNIKINNSVLSLNIGAIPEDSNATISYYKNDVLLVGNPILPITLNAGNNKITVKVTAENTVNTKDYIINVNRISDDNSINGINITDPLEVTTQLTGSGPTYSTTVYNSVDHVIVEALKNNPAATVLGNQRYDLHVGLNTIDIYVTSESGTTAHYILEITRDP